MSFRRHFYRRFNDGVNACFQASEGRGKTFEGGCATPPGKRLSQFQVELIELRWRLGFI